MSQNEVVGWKNAVDQTTLPRHRCGMLLPKTLMLRSQDAVAAYREAGGGGCVSTEDVCASTSDCCDSACIDGVCGKILTPPPPINVAVN